VKVTVLYGGPSAEREVSLVSGGAVIDGLRSMGHEVFASDISPADLVRPGSSGDVIFPVLHGQFGESGELQEILEARQLRFVGSFGRVAPGDEQGADQAGMGARRSADAGVSRGSPRRADGEPIPGSCVVKAIDSGSSIDVYVCKAPAELPHRRGRR
jgi:D-alanine-D-alanine ligase